MAQPGGIGTLPRHSPAPAHPAHPPCPRTTPVFPAGRRRARGQGPLPHSLWHLPLRWVAPLSEAGGPASVPRGQRCAAPPWPQPAVSSGSGQDWTHPRVHTLPPDRQGPRLPALHWSLAGLTWASGSSVLQALQCHPPRAQSPPSWVPGSLRGSRRLPPRACLSRTGVVWLGTLGPQDARHRAPSFKSQPWSRR